MDDPVMVFEDGLAETVTVTGRTRAVIGSPVAFNAQNKSAGFFSVANPEINVESGFADLWNNLVAQNSTARRTDSSNGKSSSVQ